MTPLRNTDKYLSDYLPPALVKDWRQCFRSRSSVALFLLLELAGWLIFTCMVADADKSPHDWLEQLKDIGNCLYALGVVALCLIIPFRAGSTVAADTRVRSSNFLMLTPLSSRRIVWGTWSSTALIVLLAALCAMPLLFARRAMMSAYPNIGEFELQAFDWFGFTLDSLLLGWLVVVGWVAAGFYMFSSMLPRILRVLLLVFGALMALSVIPYDEVGVMFGVCSRGYIRDEVLQLPQLESLVLCLLDAALLLVLFIELARRHYAAPAENCSRSVRLLAPLPLLIYVLLLFLACLGWEPSHPDADAQCTYGFIFLFTALLADALLPSYDMPAHAWRLWRGLPAWFQKPGFVPSTLCLALGSLALCLPALEEAWVGGVFSFRMFLKFLYVSLNFGCCLMLWLLITDCFCRRSAPKRPLVFGVVAFACTLAAWCIRIPLQALPEWKTALPQAGLWFDGGGIKGDAVPVACVADGAAFFILLLLLVFWRGCRRNG